MRRVLQDISKSFATIGRYGRLVLTNPIGFLVVLFLGQVIYYLTIGRR